MAKERGLRAVEQFRIGVIPFRRDIDGRLLVTREKIANNAFNPILGSTSTVEEVEHEYTVRDINTQDGTITVREDSYAYEPMCETVSIRDPQPMNTQDHKLTVENPELVLKKNLFFSRRIVLKK